ncbi:uncharacterized, partial [Tachysurus ichikawai]
STSLCSDHVSVVEQKNTETETSRTLDVMTIKSSDSWVKVLQESRLHEGRGVRGTNVRGTFNVSFDSNEDINISGSFCTLPMSYSGKEELLVGQISDTHHAGSP